MEAPSAAEDAPSRAIARFGCSNVANHAGDSVTAALEEAKRRWGERRNSRELRRALLAILFHLDESA